MLSHMPKILAIIPARSGSKGVIKKNTRNFVGKKMYQWTVDAAVQSEMFESCVVSTDDEIILSERYLSEIGIQYLKRPAELAQDNSTVEQYVDHVLLNSDKKFDFICILQPSSPLRTAKDIRCLILKTIRLGEDYGVTVTDVPHQYTPASILSSIDKDICETLTPLSEQVFLRQKKQQYLGRNGAAIYLCSVDKYLETKSVIGDRSAYVKMKNIDSIDIDNIDDFHLAEIIMKDRLCVK